MAPATTGGSCWGVLNLGESKGRSSPLAGPPGGEPRRGDEFPFAFGRNNIYGSPGGGVRNDQDF